MNFVHLYTFFDCIVLDFLYEYVKCASFVLVFLCVYFLLFVCNACQKKKFKKKIKKKTIVNTNKH